MAKKCPVCGTEFPNFAKVCDQHGVPLVAERSPLKTYIAVALAAVALLAAVPFAIGQYLTSKLTAEIKSVHVEKAKPGAVSNNQDLSHWLSDKNLNVRLSIRNHSRLPIAISAATCKVMVSTVEALSADAKGNLDIKPGATQEVDWKISLGDANLRQLLLQPPKQGIPAEIIADVQLRIAGIPWTAPVRQRILLKPALNF